MERKFFTAFCKKMLAVSQKVCKIALRQTALLTPLNGLLAQSVEQRTFNPLVKGSIPLQPSGNC